MHVATDITPIILYKGVEVPLCMLQLMSPMSWGSWQFWALTNGLKHFHPEDPGANSSWPDIRWQVCINPQALSNPLNHFKGRLVALYNSLFIYSKACNFFLDSLLLREIHVWDLLNCVLFTWYDSMASLEPFSFIVEISTGGCVLKLSFRSSSPWVPPC